MKKMLIYVDDAIHARLRRISFDSRRSMAALVREAVHGWLRKDQKRKGGGKS
jgi:predicted transcriptional regulator